MPLAISLFMYRTMPVRQLVLLVPALLLLLAALLADTAAAAAAAAAAAVDAGGAAGFCEENPQTDETIRGAMKMWLENQTAAAEAYGHVSDWEVSRVTDMSYLLCGSRAKCREQHVPGADKFNDDISQWKVASVTTMEGMFSYASAFNQPLDAWNVERVTNMEDMFYNARAFNQPLNAWNVGRVTTMREMFIGASAFDQESLSWVIPLRCSTGYMFRKYA